MSEHIPEYIGSKLGVFHEDEAVMEPSTMHLTEETDQESEPVLQSFQPPKESKVMLNKRKKEPTGKVKKTRKKTGEGATKTLPVNPGAVKQVEEVIPPIPVAELPDLEALKASADIEEKADQETNLAESLKSLPGKKKRTPRAKKVIKRRTKTLEKDQVDKEEQPTASKLEELTTSHDPKPEPAPETSDLVLEKPAAPPKKKTPVAKKKVTVNRGESRPADVRTQPVPAVYNWSSSNEIQERRAYVQKLKDETHSFLKQLAKEREERVRSLEKLRKDIREQLAKK